MNDLVRPLLLLGALAIAGPAAAQGPVNVNFTGAPGPDTVTTGIAVSGDVSLDALVRASLVGDVQFQVGGGAWNDIFSLSVPAPELNVSVPQQAIDFSAPISDTPTGTMTVVQVNDTRTTALRDVSVANTSLNLTPNPQDFSLNTLTASASLGFPISFSTTILGQPVNVDTILGPEIEITAGASGTLQNLGFQQDPGLQSAGTALPVLFQPGSFSYPSIGLTGIPGSFSTDVSAVLDATLAVSFLGLPIGDVAISQGVPTINTGALPFALPAAMTLTRGIVPPDGPDDMTTRLSAPLPIQILPTLPIPIPDITGNVPLDASIAFPETTLVSFEVLGQTVTVALRNAALVFDPSSGVDYGLVDAGVEIGSGGNALNYTLTAFNAGVVPVPEASTIAMLAIGLGALGASRRGRSPARHG